VEKGKNGEINDVKITKMVKWRWELS